MPSQRKGLPVLRHGAEAVQQRTASGGKVQGEHRGIRCILAVQRGGKAAAGHALTVAGSGHAGAHAVQLLPGAQTTALQIAGIHRQAGRRKVFHREVHQHAAQLRCRGIAQQLYGSFAVQQGRLARKTRLLRRSTDPGKQRSRKADRTGTGTFQE